MDNNGVWCAISGYLYPIEIYRLRAVSRSLRNIFSTDNIMQNMKLAKSAKIFKFDDYSFERSKCFDIETNYNAHNLPYIDKLQFVYKLHMNDSKGFDITKYTNLRHLCLYDDNIHLERLGNLTQLDSIEIINKRPLTDLSTIKTIRCIKINKLAPMFDKFAQLENVVSLNIKMHSMNIKIPFMPKLRCLILGYGWSHDNICEDLMLDYLEFRSDNFSKLPNITTLKHLKINHYMNTDLSNAKNMQDLTTVHINDYNSFIDLGPLTNVVNLKLTNCYEWLSSYIKNIDKLTKLQYVEIWRASNDIDCKLFENAKKVHIIRCINIINAHMLNEVPDVKIVYDTRYMKEKEISELRSSGCFCANNFNDFDKLHLGSFIGVRDWQNLSNVRDLTIKDCNISAKIWRMNKMDKLTISTHNKINVIKLCDIKTLKITNSCKIVNLSNIKNVHTLHLKNIDCLNKLPIIECVDTVILENCSIEDISTFAHYNHIILIGGQIHKLGPTNNRISINDVLKYKNVAQLSITE